MKVKELVNFLEKYDQDTEIMVGIYDNDWYEWDYVDMNIDTDIVFVAKNGDYSYIPSDESRGIEQEIIVIKRRN